MVLGNRQPAYRATAPSRRPARGLNAISAQVVMVLLNQTLRQWQLWKFVEDTVANLMPESLAQRPDLRRPWVVIYLGHCLNRSRPVADPVDGCGL